MNPDHMKPFPYKQVLSQEEEHMILEIQESRPMLHVINRLTFRFNRLKENQLYSTTIDFDKEFPIAGEHHVALVEKYFRLKGFSIKRVPRNRPRDLYEDFDVVFRFDWSNL